MGASYTDGDCARFVDDMIRAGFEVEHYEGPFGWQGPAVTVDDPRHDRAGNGRGTSVGQDSGWLDRLSRCFRRRPAAVFQIYRV